MNKDGHSIFEKYKNTSAKQQIVEEGMKDVLKSRNEQVITEVEAAEDKPDSGGSEEARQKFLASPKAVALKKLLQDDEINSLAREIMGIKAEDDEAGDPKHPDYKERKALIYQNQQRIDHEDYQRKSAEHDKLKAVGYDSRRGRAQEIRRKFGVGGSDIPRMPPRT